MERVAAFNQAVQARQLASNGSYARAFDLYLSAFEVCPELKGRVEGEFRQLLGKYNEYLAAVGRMREIFVNFDRAMTAYPESVAILCDTAGYLFKYDFLRDACNYYQKALTIDAGFVTAEKSLNNIKNIMVERWHFRMLNDRVRNKAYREALEEVVRPLQETVLDLGTGTGLLAVYAHQCNPMMVTACDSSPTMIELAQYVLDEAGIEDTILVTMESTDMTYRDIGGKRSLIVSEIFDAGLLGEGALQTLVHAQEHLTSPRGRFLPAAAQMYTVAVCSPFLASRYRLNSVAAERLGFPGRCVRLLGDEPYDAEDIADISDLAYLSSPASIFKINFNLLDDMKEKLEGDEVYEVALTADKEGTVDAIVAWFNLHLTENISITTDPQNAGRAQAWQQAVFYDFVPSIVTSGGSLDLQFTTRGGKLTLLNAAPEQVYRASAETIRFLNDEEYINLISGCIGAVCIYLCQSNEVGDLDVLDFCPFPVFGLLMLRRGAQSLTCYAKSMEDKEFLIAVLEANDISLNRVKIYFEEELNLNMFKDRKFHVAYVNFIDLSGDVNTKRKELMKELKTKHMFTGGLVMPQRVQLEGQLVVSEKLRRINRVDDANVLTCSVARFINQYQVSLYLHLDLAHLEYTALSEVGTVANCCEAISPGVIDVDITQSGSADAVVCWYKIQLIENGEVVGTNRKQSFVDCMAFLADPAVKVHEGQVGNIICCADADECFKLIIDADDNQ